MALGRAGRRTTARALGARVSWLVVAATLLTGSTAAADRVGSLPEPGSTVSGLSVNASYFDAGGSWNCGHGHETIDFFSTAHGGVGPYRFNWTFGDGSPPSGDQNPVHTYDVPGGFVANLTVSDSVGGSVRATVSPAWPIPLLCAGPSPSFVPSSVLVYVGLVSVVVVGGVVVLRWRRRPPPLP